MVDLDKLETAIDNLEVSSKNILRLQSIVEDISVLIEQSEKNQEALRSLVGTINDTNEKSRYSNELSEKTFKAIEDYCTKSNETNAKFISQVNTLLLEMRNESTSLYKTFETTITSKFELFKSDVLVENRKIIDSVVEKIGSEIQRSKDDITKNTKENTDNIIEKIDQKISKKVNLIIALAASTIIISIISVIIQII